MALKVLVVDDSSFFRRRVSDILNQDPDLEVIGTAVNGKEAVEKAIELRPDAITMDVEMPVMDGITSVRKIMSEAPTSILMFSSLTHQGAKATFDALDAGALDFLPKKFEDIARDKKEAGETLQQRVKAIARKRAFHRPAPRPSQTRTTARPMDSRATASPSPAAKPADTSRLRSSHTPPARQRPLSEPTRPSSAPPRMGAERTRTMDNTSRLRGAPQENSAPAAPAPSAARPRRGGEIKLLAIGTSTGGPVALQKILTALPQQYPQPILLVQHMPATFTSAFAARLNSLCKITVKEAENGEVLKPGVAYLAPGGTQMLIEGSANSAKLKVRNDDSPRITYKPSVDITFGSAAKVFQDKVLGVILTGMGADGREGSRMLKNAGSRIWAQDEQSCVVYGMPQAVTIAGISEVSLPLNDIADRIIKEAGNG